MEDLLTLAKARSHSGSLPPTHSGLTLTLPSVASGLLLSTSGGLSGRSGSRERCLGGSGSRDGGGPVSTRGLALEAVPEGPGEPPSHSPVKPRLFQATPVTDSESECVIRVYSWVPLGIYDDDDLHESAALLLCTGRTADGEGGGSHLWIGADFDVAEVVDLEEVRGACVESCCVLLVRVCACVCAHTICARMCGISPSIPPIPLAMIPDLSPHPRLHAPRHRRTWSSC